MNTTFLSLLFLTVFLSLIFTLLHFINFVWNIFINILAIIINFAFSFVIPLGSIFLSFFNGRLNVIEIFLYAKL